MRLRQRIGIEFEGADEGRIRMRVDTDSPHALPSRFFPVLLERAVTAVL